MMLVALSMSLYMLLKMVVTLGYGKSKYLVFRAQWNLWANKAQPMSFLQWPQIMLATKKRLLSKMQFCQMMVACSKFKLS